jgi:hypothetical protein
MVCPNNGRDRKYEVVTIEVKPAEALLFIRYDGEITAEEMRESLPKIPPALASLPAGFRILVDLTNLVSMDVACAPDIERVMDLCRDKGVAEIVRAIPDPQRDIGLQIMSRFHYGPGVRIVTCRTLAEARALLESER